MPTGTGFFISLDGWFLTAAHVVTKDGSSAGPPRDDIDQVWLIKETRVAGGPLGAMCQHVSLEYVVPECDLAVLRADFGKNAEKEWLKGREGFPSITVSSRELDEGESVYAFGYPLSGGATQAIPGGVVGSTSLCPRVTSAIISSTFERSRMFITGSDPQSYVLDKALNYGNSGGPIVSTETGRVHAICSRFQPVLVPQPHIKDHAGDPMRIIIPSLYGVVSSLSDRRAVELFHRIGVVVDTQ